MREQDAIVVFESDPGGVAADAYDASDALARFANGSLVVTCKDSQPQFGKDDVDVIRFASIRFDHALDENDRLAVTRALASHDTSIASWASAAQRSYAIARSERPFAAAMAAEIGATIDEPAILVLRVRPLFAPRLSAVAHALAGPGRPRATLAAHVTESDVVIELEPAGRSLALVIALVDATLAATPGRTIEPVLPICDEVLAEYVSLRIHDTQIDVSRVLDRYVEELLEAPVSGT